MSEKRFFAQFRSFFIENRISVWNEKNGYHTIPIYENCMIRSFGQPGLTHFLPKIILIRIYKRKSEAKEK